MRNQAETRWRRECQTQLKAVGLDSAAAEFGSCGEIYGVLACGSDPKHFAELAVHTCKLRFCPTCARKLSAKLTARYLPAIKAAVDHAPRRYTFKMVNLTTSVSLYDPDVVSKTKNLYRSVSNLFDNILGAGKSDWSQKSKKAYTGEGYLVAAEFGETGRKLHFHVLFFGRFLPVRDLSDEWEAITGFQVVDVRMIKEGVKRGLKETLKYISKFEKATTGSFSGFALPQEICLLAKVFHKLRRVRTRGIFYNLPTEEQVYLCEDSETPSACPICLSRIVTYDPYDWDRMHPEMRARSLYLKRETKFSERTTSPP